jgi:hypothetical protein
MGEFDLGGDVYAINELSRLLASRTELVADRGDLIGNQSVSRNRP